MTILASGWRREPLEHGYVARRVGRLTDYQLLNGCLPEVTTDDTGELWVLCDAQSRLAERIAVAESTRPRS